MKKLINTSFNYAYENFIPLITTIEITHQCNFHCQHCYNFERRTPQENFPIMKKSDVFRVIDELAELGTLYLNFTGGEPLTHPDILDFIHYTRYTHNMEPRLKTNGSMINQKKFEQLHEAGLRSLDISLYGSSSESYELFTGKGSSYQNTKEALKILSQNEMDTSVSIIVHRHNYKELQEMIDLCQDVQLPYAISYDINERYDHSSGARKMEITMDQFIELLNGPHQQYFDYDNPEKSKQCSCARSICGVGVNGDIYPCIGAPVISGNIHQDSLKNVWKNSPVLNKIRGLKDQDFKECEKCDYITTCMRSSGSIYANTQNYTGCDTTTYKQAKIRFENKD